MSLILAIEPDRRQSLTLTTLSRARLNAELVVGDTASRALEALGSRKPDLVLTSPRLTDTDEATLASRLRAFEVAGTPVPRMVIPQLGPPPPDKRGKVGKLRAQPGPAYCAPLVFGEQIADCLETAAAERAALAAAQAELEAAWAAEVTDSQSKTAASAPPQSFILEPTALEAPRQLIVAAVATPPVGEPVAPVAPMPSIVSVTPMSIEIVDSDPSAPSLEIEMSLESCGEPTADDVLPAPDRADWEELSLEAVGPSDRGPDTVSLDAPEPPSPPVIEAVALDAELEAFVIQLEASPRAVEQDDHLVVAALEPPVALLDAASTDADPASMALEARTAIDEQTRVPLPISSSTESVTDLTMGASTDPAYNEVGEAARAETALLVPDGQRPALVLPPDAPEEPVLPPARPAAGIHDVLSAIRRDIQHLRGDEPARPRPAAQPVDVDGSEATLLNLHAPASAVVPPGPDEAPTIAASGESSETAAPPIDTGAPAVDPVASREPRREPMPWRPRIKSRPPTVPVQDEWGFFDPERCGFEALRAKLNEMIEEHARKRTA